MDKLTLLEGSPLNLGRRAFIVPALNIKMMKALKPELAIVEKGAGTAEDAQETFLSALTALVVAALTRNYPEITADFVEEHLDFNNIPSAVRAVLGSSGYTTTDPDDAHKRVFGEEVKSGE